MRRRRSSRLGKNDLCRSLGIDSSTSPAAGVSRPVAVALGGAGLAALVAPRADVGGRLGFDELLENPPQAGADGVGHLARLERSEQLGQVRIGEGHRWVSFVVVAANEHVEDPAGGPLSGGPSPIYTTTGDVP